MVFWAAQNVVNTISLTNETNLQFTVIDQVNFLKDPHGVNLE